MTTLIQATIILISELCHVAGIFRQIYVACMVTSVVMQGAIASHRLVKIVAELVLRVETQNFIIWERFVAIVAIDAEFKTLTFKCLFSL